MNEIDYKLLNILIDDKLFELTGYEKHEKKFATNYYIHFYPEFSAQYKVFTEEL